jgi:hypothetical protein
VTILVAQYSLSRLAASVGDGGGSFAWIRLEDAAAATISHSSRTARRSTAPDGAGVEQETTTDAPADAGHFGRPS